MVTFINILKWCSSFCLTRARDLSIFNPRAEVGAKTVYNKSACLTPTNTSSYKTYESCILYRDTKTQIWEAATGSHSSEGNCSRSANRFQAWGDKCIQSINTPMESRFYILFQNLQNKFQVQESRISLDTMQSIIYRRIKYILYIADKPWWVLHMYSMYVNFYVQSFLHIQKALFLFFFIYIYIYIYIYLYIEIFHILPTSICTTIMKKKKTFTYMSIHFFFLYYKCIFIKIYLCTKEVFYSLTCSLFSETLSL